jgi:hypothetical protein
MGSTNTLIGIPIIETTIEILTLDGAAEGF